MAMGRNNLELHEIIWTDLRRHCSVGEDSGVTPLVGSSKQCEPLAVRKSGHPWQEVADGCIERAGSILSLMWVLGHLGIDGIYACDKSAFL